MSLADAWGGKPEPEEELSLAEEAHTHAPPLWTPPVLQPDVLTELPADFPVPDPFALNDHRAELKEAFKLLTKCELGEKCSVGTPEKLGNAVAKNAMHAIGILCALAEEMHRHGDELAAEELAYITNKLGVEILKPYLLSKGVIPDA